MERTHNGNPPGKTMEQDNSPYLIPLQNNEKPTDIHNNNEQIFKYLQNDYCFNCEGPQCGGDKCDIWIKYKQKQQVQSEVASCIVNILLNKRQK